MEIADAPGMRERSIGLRRKVHFVCLPPRSLSSPSDDQDAIVLHEAGCLRKSARIPRMQAIRIFPFYKFGSRRPKVLALRENFGNLSTWIFVSKRSEYSDARHDCPGNRKLRVSGCYVPAYPSTHKRRRGDNPESCPRRCEHAVRSGTSEGFDRSLHHSGIRGPVLNVLSPARIRRAGVHAGPAPELQTNPYGAGHVAKCDVARVAFSDCAIAQ